jgi:hypothetical protein
MKASLFLSLFLGIGTIAGANTFYSNLPSVAIHANDQAQCEVEYKEVYNKLNSHFVIVKESKCASNDPNNRMPQIAPFTAEIVFAK